MPILALLALVILLAITGAPVLAQPVPETIGTWVLTCYRGDALQGRAFEKCQGVAPGVSIERDAQGLVGFVTGCKTEANGIFRIAARGLAKADRAARFDKAVAAVLRQCALPALPVDPGATERLLRTTDELSADWVG